MKTAIMTDTNSGISVEEGKQLGIYVMPMPVLIDDICFLEGIDITAEQLYEAMEADKKTSPWQCVRMPRTSCLYLPSSDLMSV